jgi:hypothetical protein
MLGFDYTGYENATLGGGFAYAFDRTNLSDNVGHSTYNQEFLSLYGAWKKEYFYVDAALWGGYYNVNNLRNSIAGISSTANYDGWLFLPHLELSIPMYYKCQYLFDPFVMLDWVNNWQSAIEEQGASGLNLVMDNAYTSLLRTEAGLRLSQAFSFKKGSLVFLEKGSYVNKSPFNTKANQAIYVGGISSFSVDTFSNEVQNLGVVQFSASYVPENIKRPYSMINFQGEFGSGYQSYLVSLEAGLNF